ncbi:GNAT family N-acetyltransferase [Kribbella deserti]|uniref:GNAT family N-acetyltransferase n=1 Tax=Kribbella deserti TaxID=1926257 RepID=A0ABV6QHG9_9ACTN
MDIPTSRAGLVLKALTTKDTDEYHQLVQNNAEHLTRIGNYTDLVAQSRTQIAAHLAQPSDPPLNFGIHESNLLCGTIELLPVDPPKYGLGYWLAANACGRGLATISCLALLDYARTTLDATDVYAGVSHGNNASVAMLQRAGFEPVRHFDDYTRFRRCLTQP